MHTLFVVYVQLLTQKLMRQRGNWNLNDGSGDWKVWIFIFCVGLVALGIMYLSEKKPRDPSLREDNNDES